jgi:sulfatase modifying factor 1
MSERHIEANTPGWFGTSRAALPMSSVSPTLVVVLPLLLFVACREPGADVTGVPTAVLERADGMVRLPGGTFTMGHDGSFDTPYGRKEFPEEQPAHRVTVGPFWIDETEVTNAQFAQFVAATGYVTFAERPFDSSHLPPEVVADLPPGNLANGALVFLDDLPAEVRPGGPGSESQWWRWDPTASWRAPTGSGSDIVGRDNHPVVCVTNEDAREYAMWVGKRLPTEAEWEFAARGGLEKKIFTWGNEMKPGDQWMANTWQGPFPTRNTAEDGFPGTAPIRNFPPNGYGLFDMAGNVWEHCSDFYDPEYFSACDPGNPQGPASWFDPPSGRRGTGSPRHVMKGGSFLCHVSYCMRYRPAARHSQDSESPTNHVGFRCVRD